jgi:uncharacterized protein (DUF3820 family)
MNPYIQKQLINAEYEEYKKYMLQDSQATNKFLSERKETTMRERKTLTLEDNFDFGKHKGKNLRDVANNYSGYIEWIIKQDFIDFDAEANELFEELGII